MNAGVERQPHATFDLASRVLKGRKIEQLLGLDTSLHRRRLLEVGTGSGGISHYFACNATQAFDVDSVDVQDCRQVSEGYRFQLVDDVFLPFEDALFDIVVSNHVIEHVGREDAQVAHLRELHRVLKPGGVGYLAVPNRWMLTEPHYRLKFLSWLPRRWRTPYLRLSGKGQFYDCEPLELRKLERMLDAAEFVASNLCVEGWRATLNIEQPDGLAARLLNNIPDAFLKTLNSVNPTLIYRISRRGHKSEPDELNGRPERN